jgi:pimeloyl-ACP methyl ester carboxylesterase
MVATADGPMHYVDEWPRDGRPVVLLQGNPTCGYLERNLIPPLVDAGHRVIVPDHLGFGRSDKPDRAKLYRIRRHAERLEGLLESLDLHVATVVPQDWASRSGCAGPRDTWPGASRGNSWTAAGAWRSGRSSADKVDHGAMKAASNSGGVDCATTSGPAGRERRQTRAVISA